jgi:hypothetical protein
MFTMNDNKYIKILKKARKIVESEDHYFICWAILDASYWSTSNTVREAGQEIKDYIEDALGWYDTLGQWLSGETKVPKTQMTMENLREYRLRYIDHLMEVFK